ncbi:hypothetical protein KR032_003663 [Drosophila birchii]|nr:hypothetical protein KR032_003663 [Drosophila birchii]
MDSCAKKSSRKSSSCGHQSRTSIKAKEIGYCVSKNRAGRNPFFHYLAHFRKCNKKRLCHLPARTVTLLAGRQWSHMSPEEREPFISAAKSSSYTYRSRNKKINWMVGNLQEYADGSEYQDLALWNLMSSMKSWQRHCLQNNPIKK